MIEGWEFANPNFLWLLALLPFLGGLALWRQKKSVAKLFFSAEFSGGKWYWMLFSKLPLVLSIFAFGLIILALARPQTKDLSEEIRSSEGIDIVLSLDVSGSMLSRDLKPSRLEALKVVAQEFVDNRPSDRIGLVVYAGEAFGKVPLTTDHQIVKEGISDLKFGMIEGGTSIGMGLGTAVNRIKESDGKSKVVILLTDGVSTGGQISPDMAADLAQTFNVRVYTIGVGTRGMAETPVAMRPDGSLVYQMSEVEIDEETLQMIADKTGGKYFRATSNEGLKAIYNEIDELEKSKVEELTFYQYEEKFYPLVWGAISLLLSSFLLRITFLRSAV